MISIDKAKRLKNLGLSWHKPKEGDWYSINNLLFLTSKYDMPFGYTHNHIGEIDSNDKEGLLISNEVWLPSLEQMLNEIEKYQYTFSLVGEKLTLFKKLNLVIQFECDSREDSVADALIWILENI